jgi:hypothetical protein
LIITSLAIFSDVERELGDDGQEPSIGTEGYGIKSMEDIVEDKEER